MLSLALAAFGLGIVFNAAPGVVFAESLRRGLHGGFHRAFSVQVGSLVGDAVWAVLGLAGVGVLLLIDGVRTPLMALGALLTIGLGAKSCIDAVRKHRPSDIDEADVDPAFRRRGDVAVGAALSLTNPSNVAFWGGAAASVSGALGTEPSWTALLVFFSGFFLASLVWAWICAGGITLFRRAVPTVAVRAVEAACGGFLVALGTWAAVTI